MRNYIHFACSDTGKLNVCDSLCDNSIRNVQFVRVFYVIDGYIYIFEIY